MKHWQKLSKRERWIEMSVLYLPTLAAVLTGIVSWSVVEFPTTSRFPIDKVISTVRRLWPVSSCISISWRLVLDLKLCACYVSVCLVSQFIYLTLGGTKNRFCPEVDGILFTNCRLQATRYREKSRVCIPQVILPVSAQAGQWPLVWLVRIVRSGDIDNTEEEGFWSQKDVAIGSWWNLVVFL